MPSFRNLLGLPVKAWDDRAAGQVLQLSSDKEHWEFGTGGGGGGYTLPAASASVLGGIKVGANLSIDGGGVLSAVAGGSGGHLAGTGLVLNTVTNIMRLAVTGDISIGGPSLSIGTTAGSTAQLAISGGTPPYAVTVSPALESGLTMSSGGLITNDGTAAEGPTSYTFTVTDAGNNQVSQPLSLLVSASDPYWASVISLVHFGQPSGVNVTDETGRTWTMYGSPTQVSGPFGKATRLSPSTSDGFNCAGITQGDSNWITGKFTIEAQMYYTSGQNEVANRAAQVYSGVRAPGVYNYGFGFNNSGKPSTGWWNGSSKTLSGPTAMTTAAWHHVAVSNDGTTLRVFEDGALVASLASAAVSSSAGSLWVNTYAQTAAYAICELRLTGGVARYTSNFTPPTAPFPSH